MPKKTGSGPYGSSAFGEVAGYFTQEDKRKHRKQLNENGTLSARYSLPIENSKKQEIKT